MRTKFLILALAPLLLANTFALGAPPQILNKTIEASWVVNVTLVAPNGRVVTRQVNQQRLIYISSAGRTFVKSSFSAPYGSGSAELAPGASTPKGGARDVRFEDGKLVLLANLDGGRAGRVVIGFDATYSTCNIDVTIGRSSERTVVERRGMQFEILSHAVSGQSCTVRQGNAFAS